MTIPIDEQNEKNREFIEKIEIIRNALEQTGTIINSNNYDGILVKKLGTSDTKDSQKGNVSHIALTTDMMDLFPCFISHKYYYEADESLKNYFFCMVPISLANSNLFYLSKKGEEKKEVDDKLIETFAAVSYRWYTSSKNNRRSDQMQLSFTRKDGDLFVDFRNMLHKDYFLILLRLKEQFKYEAYGLIEDKFITGDAGLSELVNNFYHYFGDDNFYSAAALFPQSLDVGLYNGFELNFENIKDNLNGFFIHDDKIKQIVAILNSHHNIILNGVPGTGKTHLAVKIAENAMGKKGYILTTATSDWTTFDTIGGLMPNQEGVLEFHEGKFLQAIRENKWLIIDEINRADIDKAFGQLFTVLSNQNVELQYTKDDKPIKIVLDNNLPFNKEINGTYYIGRNWRIIGTMNSYDKNNLFDLSYAFMRRFKFIDIEVPTDFDKLIKCWKNVGFEETINVSKDYLKKLGKLYKINSFDDIEENKNKINRQIGPAIFLDILKYIESRLKFEENKSYNDKILAEAVIAYIIPQFEGLNKSGLNNLITFFDKNIFDDISSTDVIKKLERLMPYY